MIMGFMGLKISIVVIFGLTVLGVSCTTVGLIQKAEQDPDKKVKVHRSVLQTVLVILITAASWIFNLGWIRVILAWVSFPVIHAGLFCLLNISAAYYTDNSRKQKLLNQCFMATYLLFYFFLPDFGDEGDVRFFFGLVQNNTLAAIAMYVSGVTLLVNLILFVFEVVQIRKVKKALKVKNEDESAST